MNIIRKTLKLQLAGLTFVMVVIAAGCGGNETIDHQEQAIPVTVATVEFREFLIPVYTSGRLSAGMEMKMSFKVGGVVEGFLVDEGDRVTKGQILAGLKLTEAKAQVAMTQSALQKAERDLERVRGLYSDSVATLEQMQNAETTTQVAKARAQIAQFNFDHSVIKAPADGIILKRLVEANELVAAGTPVLFVGTTDGAWTVNTGVPDRDVVRLTVGDSAIIVFDAYTNTPVEGTITEIAESPNPMTGTYEVEVSLEPIELKLMSGFSSKVTIFPKAEEPHYLIPIDALIQADGFCGFVFTIDSSQRANKINVKVSHILGDRVAIPSGLQGVNRVITQGAAYVSDGSPIVIDDSPTPSNNR